MKYNNMLVLYYDVINIKLINQSLKIAIITLNNCAMALTYCTKKHH
jgi:hypothetical protein